MVRCERCDTPLHIDADGHCVACDGCTRCGRALTPEAIAAGNVWCEPCIQWARADLERKLRQKPAPRGAPPDLLALVESLRRPDGES
jgi:hypothetical protein